MRTTNTYSIFEYGYLVSDRDREKVQHAQPLPDAAFLWLEQRCLKDADSNDSRLLSLRTLKGVKVIQVKNYVGVIALPQNRLIEVLPKTGKKLDDKSEARSQLVMMLQTLKTFRHIQTASASIMTSRMTLMDIFIQQFVASVDIIVRKGLRHDYLRQQDSSAWLKGKLQVGEQLKRNSVRRDRFFVEYDEYRVERPENRLLKTAIARVYRYTGNPQILQALYRLQQLFEPIPAVHNIDVAFKQVNLDRHMQHYHPALAWAKLILTGNAPHCMQGSAEAISLLFPMEAVFEAFVTAWLRQQCPAGWNLKAQSKTHHLVQHGEVSLFQLRPDAWLIPPDTSKQRAIICDMKWKLVDAQQKNYSVAQSDLYQMQAYGLSYLQGEGNMLLIYPRHNNFQTPPDQPFEYRHASGKNLRLWVLPFHTGTSLRDSRLLTPPGLALWEAEI